WKWLGDGTFRISWSEFGAAEQRGLRAIVEFGNLAQHAFCGVAVDDVAAGQKGKRAEARRAAQEPAPAVIRHQLGGVFDQQSWINAGNDLALAHGRSS